MIEYYFNPQATSDNLGTELHPWNTRDAMLTYLNTTHPNLITEATAVKVWWLGTSTLSTAGSLNVQCNATYPLIFEVPVGLRNPGVWDTSLPGIYAGTTMSTGWFELTQPDNSTHYIIFDGLTCRAPGNSPTTTIVRQMLNRSTSSRTVFRNCYIKGRVGGHGSGTDIGAVLTSDTRNRANVYGIFENCIFEDFLRTSGQYSVYQNAHGGNVANVYNCTFIDFVNGTDVRQNAVNMGGSGSPDFRGVNNLCINATLPGTTAGTYILSYNANNGTIPEGTGNNTGSIDTVGLFVSETDRKLQFPNVWGAGPDTPTYGVYVPLTDIEGNDRTGEIASVGAHEPGQVAAEPKDIFPVNEMISGRATTDGGN